MLTGVTSVQQKALALSESILKLLNPQPTERTAYADYTRQIMYELHPKLWRPFQSEPNELLQQYLRQNDQLIPPRLPRPAPPLDQDVSDPPMSDVTCQLSSLMPADMHDLEQKMLTRPLQLEIAL